MSNQKVTSDALVKRINRRLAPEHKKLCKSKPREWANLGDYHVLDTERNAVIAFQVNIEELGRELGVLDQRERVAETTLTSSRSRARRRTLSGGPGSALGASRGSSRARERVAPASAQEGSQRGFTRSAPSAADPGRAAVIRLRNQREVEWVVRVVAQLADSGLVRLRVRERTGLTLALVRDT